MAIIDQPGDSPRTAGNARPGRMSDREIDALRPQHPLRRAPRHLGFPRHFFQPAMGPRARKRLSSTSPRRADPMPKRMTSVVVMRIPTGDPVLGCPSETVFRSLLPRHRRGPTTGAGTRRVGLAMNRVSGKERGCAGEMAERLKAHAWKACVRESVPWVRIPLSPPYIPIQPLNWLEIYRRPCFIPPMMDWKPLQASQRDKGCRSYAVPGRPAAIAGASPSRSHATGPNASFMLMRWLALAAARDQTSIQIWSSVARVFVRR